MFYANRMDRMNVSLLILSDLSVAFEKKGQAWESELHQFNFKRYQKVVHRDYNLASWLLTYGMPQSSVVSLILFNIYMMPLGETGELE